MAKLRLSPRQEAKARRNAEIRELKNQIAERDEALDFAQKLITQQKARHDRMQAEIDVLSAVPVDLVRVVYMALPMHVAIESGIIEECKTLHRWLKRYDDVEQAEKELANLTGVATSNGAAE